MLVIAFDAALIAALAASCSAAPLSRAAAGAEASTLFLAAWDAACPAAATAPRDTRLPTPPVTRPGRKEGIASPIASLAYPRASNGPPTSS